MRNAISVDASMRLVLVLTLQLGLPVDKQAGAHWMLGANATKPSSPSVRCTRCETNWQRRGVMSRLPSSLVRCREFSIDRKNVAVSARMSARRH